MADDALEYLQSGGSLLNQDPNEAALDYLKSGSDTPQPAISQTESQPTTSAAGATLRAAGEGLGPTAAAAAAFEPSALIGAPLGPIGAAVTGIAGSAIAGAAAGWAQHKAAQLVAPEATQNFDQLSAADAAQHPIAGAVGRIAAALPMFEYSPGQSIKGVAALWKAAKGVALTEAEKGAAAATAAQVGLGTGTAVVQPYLFGDSPTKQGIAEAFVQSLLLGEPRHHFFGKAEVTQIADEEAAKDKAAAKENPVENPETNYGAPPPPDLTPEQRANLSFLAYKSATDAPIDTQDHATHQLMVDNPAASQEFNKQKAAWSQIFTRQMAEQAQAKAPDTEFDLRNYQPPKADDTSTAAATATTQIPSTQAPPADTVTSAPHAGQGDLSTTAAVPPTAPNPITPPVAPPAPAEAGKPLVPSKQIKEAALVMSKGDFLRWVKDKGYKATAQDWKDINSAPAEQSKISVPEAQKQGQIPIPGQPGAVATPPPAIESPIEAVKPPETPVAPEPAKPVEPPKVEAAKPTAPAAPSWESFRGDPEKLLAEMKASSAPPMEQTGGNETGRGVRDTQLYRELKPTEDPLSPTTINDVLYKGAKSNKDSRLESQKRIVMQSPDGTHVTVSTPGEVQRTRPSGKKMWMKSVATYGPDGRVTNRLYSDLVHEGWKPLGAIKLDRAARNEVATYSKQQWSEIRSKLYDTNSEVGIIAGKLHDVESGVETVDQHQAKDIIGGPSAEAAKSTSITGDPNAPVERFVGGGQVVLSPEEAAHLSKTIGKPMWKDEEDAHDVISNALGAARPDILKKILLRVSPKDANHPDTVDFEAGYKKLLEHLYKTYEAQRTAEAGKGGSNDISAGNGKPPGPRSDAKSAGASGPEAANDFGRNKPAAVPGSEQSGAPKGGDADAKAGSAKLPAAPEPAKPAAAKDAGGVKPSTPKIEVVKATEGLPAEDLEKLSDIAEQIAVDEGTEEDWIEHARDEILTEGVAVKVDGEVAMLFDGEIHTQDGETIPAPADLLAAVSKNRARQAKEDVTRLAPTTARTAEAANAAVKALRAIGIRIDVIIDPMAKHYSEGDYAPLLNGRGNAIDVIRWHVADASSPTPGNLAALFHEAGHAVFSKLPPEVQAAALRAIGKLTDERLGIEGFKEQAPAGTEWYNKPWVEQEGRLVEALGQKLVAEGFHPQDASGWAQKIWRVISDVAHGVYLGVMKMAGYPPSDERALAFFQHRMQMALRGEKPMALINFLGGARTKLPDWDHIDAMGQNTGRRFSGINRVTNPRRYLETKEGAPIGIAALNDYIKAGSDIIRQWNLTGNLSGMSDLEVAKKFLKFPEQIDGTDLFADGKLPGSLVADAAKQHGVSPTTRIEDLPSDVGKQRAQAVLHRMLAETQMLQDGAAVEAHKEWSRGVHDLEMNNNQLVRLTKDFTNIDYMTKVSRNAMLDLISNEKRTVKGIREYSEKDGAIGQTIKQLDQSIKKGDDIPVSYRKALDEIHRALVDPENDKENLVPLTDILNHAGKLDLDWDKPTNTLKEELRAEFNKTKDQRLGSMFQDTPKSRAVLATVISFGKSNSHIMDMLAERMDGDIENRAKASKMLKDFMDKSDDNLGDLRQRVYATFRNLRTRDRMMRLGRKIGDLRKANKDLAKQNESNKDAVDFHREAFTPLIGDRMRKLEGELGISTRSFEVYHGAKVPVPTSRDAGPEKFVEKTLSVRSDVGKKGERPTPTPEVVGWMNAMQDWLENPDNTKHGAKYNEVAEAAYKLGNHYVSNEHLNLRSDMISRFLSPLQEMCNQAGTPNARHAGQSINKYSAALRSKTREIIQRGTVFATALNDARTAAGYPATSEKTFWDNQIGPALHDLEQNGERIWAAGKTREERKSMAVEQALRYMNQNGKLPPAANAAVAKLLRLHIENSDYMVANGRELGLKVLDQSGEYKIYRHVLGEAPTTLPRQLTDIAENFYREHMGAWGGNQLKMADVAKAYDKDPASLAQMLGERFKDPQVMGWFVKSLAYNDRSHFYAPKEGGVAPMANRERVMQAFDAAKGDVVKFAENLSELHGYKPNGDFVAETLDTIQNFHNLLRTMVGDDKEAGRGGSPNPKRFIVDARHIEAAPSEWLHYLMTDQYNMERINHGQAFESGFGRNGSAMEKHLGTAISEQSEALSNHDAWRAAILQENPGLKEGRLQSLLKAKCDAEGVSYASLRNARRNLDTLNKVQEHYDALKGFNASGNVPEMRPWARLMRTIGGWTVSGAGTAITAHSVFLEQPTRLLGLGPRSGAMTLRSLSDFGKVMANSMLQAVGHQCIFESERMLAANRAGISDTLNTNRQRLIAAWQHAHSAYEQSGPVGKTVGKLADTAGALLQTDAYLAPGARAKALARQANGQAVAPTLKVFSPFHFVAESLQISNFITWQRHIESLVVHGVNHLMDHPELAEDNNWKMTRETTGNQFGDREFRFLQQRMADFGFSMEHMVRQAYKNRAAGSDKPILSAEANKSIQQLTLNEITLESSLTSRMPVLQVKGLGVAMNPFLGWPLQKTFQVLRQLREPDGSATQKALIGGLAAYAAILPLGMAAAYLRNKFDEDVLGRKQNISDLSQIHDVPSGIMTALDNASRIGTFGFIGEGANYFASNDNVRPLSLDSRVFFVNTLLNTINTAKALYHQTAPQLMRGDFAGAEKTATDYQTVLRPLFQSLGGNGLLQNLGAMNHALALDDDEARVSNRISVNNYLRVAGRETGAEVRTFAGMMQNQTTPNPMKPFIGQMVLAAQANDGDDFKAAMKQALSEAKTETARDPITGKERPLTQAEAMKKVATMYDAQNPIKIVFKSLTPQEYQKVMAQLPDNGKQAVAQSLRLYQHYGQQIGVSADLFTKAKAQADPTSFKMPAMATWNQSSRAATTGLY